MPEELVEENDVDLMQDLGEAGTPTPEPKAQPNDELKSALTELTGLVHQSLKKPEPEPRKLSPEEEQEAWGVYNPEKSNKEFFRKFFRITEDVEPAVVDELKALFGEMQKGLVRQSIIGSRNLFQQELEKLRGEFGPIHEYVSQTKAREQRSRFSETFPALADKKFDNILRIQANALANQEFANEEEFFQALAESAAGVIKTVQADFDLGAKPETKKPAGTTPKLPRGGAGGGGGAGNGGGPKKQPGSDDSDDIFED